MTLPINTRILLSAGSAFAFFNDSNQSDNNVFGFMGRFSIFHIQN